MALSTLEAQGSMANANPNIISDTYTGAGAANATTPITTPPPQATAIPGMEQASQLATSTASQLYGNGAVSGMETQRNAMMAELSDYDSMLGQVYAGKSMYPQVEGYVDNPADRVSGLAGISGATAGNIGRVASAVDTTERAYNMAISNVMDRFLSFAQLQQQQRQFDREMDLKQKELDLKSGPNDKATIKRQALAALYGGQPDAEGNIVLSALGGQSPKVTKEGYLRAIQIDPEGSSEYWQKYQDENKVTNLTPTQLNQMKMAKTNQDNVKNLYALWSRLPASQRGPEARNLGRLSQLAQGGPYGENLAAQYDKARLAMAYQALRSQGVTGNIPRAMINDAMSALPDRYESEQMAEPRFARLLQTADENVAFTINPSALAMVDEAPLSDMSASNYVAPSVSAGANQQIPVYDTVTGGYGRATQDDIKKEPGRFKVLNR